MTTSIGSEILRAMGKRKTQLQEGQDKYANEMYGKRYAELTDSQQASVMFAYLWNMEMEK